MRRRKSLDPTDRLGVYKRFEEVPTHNRLEQYAEKYHKRDVWCEFCTDHEYQQGNSDGYLRAVDRAGKHWLAHMERQERHHALATPDDVEAWCGSLIDDKSLATAYNYWVRIKRFYNWLVWHVDHPHVYDPVLMAAAAGGAAGQIWDKKVQKWQKARARYHQDE